MTERRSFQMQTLGYYNGIVNDLDHSMVPMLDRGFYFGDGVFNVAYSRNYHIYELKAHIEELFRSACALKIEPPVSGQDLSDLLDRLIRKMDSGDLWIYMQFTRGTAIRLHPFPKTGEKANLTVMIKPSGLQDVRKKLRCITVEDRRHLLCNVKTLNYVANVLAVQEAMDAGADDCILHRGEIVTECAHANLAILKNGKVFTHPANEYIYAGVGRALMLKECEKHGIPYEERPIMLDELFTADEVFRVSGSSLCMRVAEIDGKPIGGKDEKNLTILQNGLLEKFLRETD